MKSSAAAIAADLIVVDGLCPRIAELLPAALHEVVALRSGPLAAITTELAARRRQGQPVRTLHLVAHGRAGAVQIGGEWIDARQLIAAADQLASWQVEQIALWSCEVGADRDFVALLEELSGARVWASGTRLGRVGAANNWRLQARGGDGTPLLAPWSDATLEAWPHQLASITFSQGAVAVTNTVDKESNFHEFAALPGGLLAGPVSITDGTGGQNFSGNDVSVILTIGTNTYFGWISRPIKIQGKVVGFYFWSDNDFDSLAAAQFDGNADKDGQTSDNFGFLLIVDPTKFTTGGIGSSSDRVDNALNALIVPNSGPLANPDLGGPAIEAGCDVSGNDASGNVLLNDTDVDAGDTKTLINIGTTAPNVGVSAGTTSTNSPVNVVGSYGTLFIGADGSYIYKVDNTNPEVDALRTAADQLFDVFTYTMQDSGGLTSTTTLTITIGGANDKPVANDDFNTARESLLPDTNANQYGPSDPLGALAVGNVFNNDTDVDDGDTQNISVISITGSATAISTANPTGVQTLAFTALSSSIKVGYFVFDTGTGKALFDSAGNQITVTGLDAATNSLTLSGVVSQSGLPLAAYTLFNNTTLTFTKNSDGSGNSKTDTITTATNQSTSTLTSLTGVSGTVAVGMEVTGAGVPAGARIIQVVRDATNTVTSIVIDRTFSAPLAVPLTFNETVTIDPSGVELQGSYGILQLQADGSYVYTPFANNPALGEGQSAIDTFTYTLLDASGCSDTATLNITVFGSDASGTDVSGIPVAVSDLDSALEAGGPCNPLGGTGGIDASGNVLLNDGVSDASGVAAPGVLSVTQIGTDSSGVFVNVAGSQTIQGEYGALTIDASGNYTYVVDNVNSEVQALNVGDDLFDVFRYVAAGEDGSTDISTLTIRIDGANDFPCAEDDEEIAVEAAGSPGNPIDGFDPTGNVLFNDEDVDNPFSDLSVTAIRDGSGEGFGSPGIFNTPLQGLYGTLTIDQSGNWTYTVDQDDPAVNALGIGDELIDAFNYDVTDGSGTDTAVLRIKIQGGEDSVDINDVFVNEASPYAVFTITGQPGVALTLSVGAEKPPLANTDLLATPGPSGDYLQTLEVYNPVTNTWELYDPSGVSIPASGQLLARLPILPDTDPEGNENFTLTATTTDGIASTGIGTINDQGEGALFGPVDQSGNIPLDLSGNPIDNRDRITLDDDRRLVVSGATYNEASKYIFWSVSGAIGQKVVFKDLLGVGDPDGADPLLDLSGVLQYRDASGVWQTFDGSTTPVIDFTSTLLIRKLAVNDDVFEGKEDFSLIVANTGGTDASGISSLTDDGSGRLPTFDNSGNFQNGVDPSGLPQDDPTTVKDDDQTLTVQGALYNEAAGYIFWTISGGQGQPIKLISLTGSPSGAIPDGSGADLSGDLQYLDASGIWQTFDGTSSPKLDSSGKLLVRKAIVNDGTPEGAEQFILTVGNLVGAGDFSGTSSVIDDGTGLIPTLNGSGTPTGFDASGIPADDFNAVRDDDRPLTVSGATYNEASPYIYWTVSGVNGQIVQLVGLTGTPSPGADPTADLIGSLEYLDASGTWRSWTSLDPLSSPRLGSTGQLIVRKSVFNDQIPEGLEAFQLSVKNTGGTTATGTSNLIDNGTGVIPQLDSSGNPKFDGSGNPLDDLTKVKDDDRTLTVNGGDYNEASPFIYWTVSGAAAQPIKFVSLTGNPAGADPLVDLSGNLQYLDGSGIWQTLDPSSSPVLDGSGTLVIRKEVFNDGSPEGLENFVLTVENTGGTDASGVSSLNDDGSGVIPQLDGSGNPKFDGSGKPLDDLTKVKDDDRTLTVSGAVYNEGTAFIFWTVSGASGQTVKFGSLVGGTTTPGADPDADLSGSLQYLDGVGVWRTFDGTSSAVLDGNGKLLIRKAVVNDFDPEGQEDFILTVANTGNTDASGVSSLIDDGSGRLPSFDNSGNLISGLDPSGLPLNDPSKVKDDDRILTVSGGDYNEASPFIYWTVSGASGQTVKLVSLAGDSSAAQPDVDLSGNLQYLDASGIWRTFDGSSNPAINTNGKLLIRKEVFNDGTPEGLEKFILTVENTGKTDASGVSSLNDDGTGVIPQLDGSGNPKFDGFGNPLDDGTKVKDDDRTLTVSGGDYNEASPFIYWTVSGAAAQPIKFVSLTGNPAGANPLVDLSGNLQYLDGSGIWQTLNPGSSPVLDGSGTLVIRKAVFNDGSPEGLENFVLTVENTGGTDASGVSSLNDDGSGVIPQLDGSGNPKFDGSGKPLDDLTKVKDDDRTLIVSGATYNEASPYIYWTVSGAVDQIVKFVDLDGDPFGAALPNVDLSGNLQYLDASGIWQTLDGSSSPVISAGGKLLIRKAVFNDGTPEGLEDFILTVENTGGTDASGTSSLIDDGTGTIPKLDVDGNPRFDASGQPLDDDTKVKDDDRTLTVSGASYNEASAFIFWTVSGSPGQTVNFISLTGAGDPSGAQPNVDLSGNLQYLDAAGNWQTFDASSGPALNVSGKLLIRKAVVNDGVPEGREDFVLTVANTGETDASGSSSLFDDGRGRLPSFDSNGNLISGLDSAGLPLDDPSNVKDDDRILTVSGATYNEASPFIYWTVSGASGQTVKFVSLTADPFGADPEVDLSGNLQYLDGSGVWRTFDGSSSPVISPNGKLLIRKAVVNDDTPEGLEDFILTIENTGGTDASGASSLADDGSGVIPQLDGSGNPKFDAFGNPIPSDKVNDDDRRLTITGGDYNEASPFIFWTVNGAVGQTVKFLSLTGDSLAANPNIDLSGNLQYLDASGTWRTFDGLSSPVINAGGTLLIRKAVFNDTDPEGLEKFILTVENTGGTDVSGVSSLNDNGSGAIPQLDSSGNPKFDELGNPLDSNAVKDDDRTLTVSGATYNEAAPFIFWTVSGAVGQTVKLVSLIGDSLAAQPDVDLSGNLQYLDSSGTWRTFDGGSSPAINANGKLLIRKAVFNDGIPEGLEQFSLTVENTGGTDATGISSLIDNGTGVIPQTDSSGNPKFDGSGNPLDDLTKVKDDDRTLTVSGASYNEASAFIFWTLTGASGQTVKFVSLTGDPSGANPNVDLSGNLQYLDGGGIWRTFDGASSPVLDGNGKLLIRKAVVNDGNPEGRENFILTVENTGGTDASGTSALLDDGSGRLPSFDPQGNLISGLDPSGLPLDDPSKVKDDDRILKVSGATYNEASPFIYWTVSGAVGQTVRFLSLTSDPAGADPAVDLSGNLQYLDDSGVWKTLDGSISPVINSGGKLLIRKAVVNDTTPEGREDFILRVENTGKTAFSGTSSLIDDGSGLIPLLDGSGNPRFDASGALIDDGTKVKDDDRTLTVSGAIYNEASPFIYWTVSGASGQIVNFGGLSGDPSGADPNVDLSGNLQYLDLSGNWRAFDGSSVSALNSDGKLLIRKAVVNDVTPEGQEDFILKVLNTGKADFSGTSSLIDNGSGVIPALDASGNPLFDGSGKPQDDPQQVKDDDRTLTVLGAVYNEASPFIFWTVTGAVGQTVKFRGLTGDPSGADPAVDLSGNLQYLDASGNWQTFDGGSSPVINSGGTLVIRKAVVNDPVLEGLETFNLVVENTGGTDFDADSSLIDTGAGLIPALDPSGTPVLDASGIPQNDPTRKKDDDRALQVTGAPYNEASPFIFWTVTGASGQSVGFVGLTGDPSGADPNVDLTGPLQYRDPSGVWQTFDPSSNPVLDASGTLLIRKAVVNDDVLEGTETFTLVVENGGGTDYAGSSSLNDQALGLIPQLDASGNPTLDASGIPLDDPTKLKDDDSQDEDEDGIPGDIEVDLANQVTGNGLGDLNGDGIPDNRQPAYAVLAWITVDKFEAALNGSLNAIEPIIALTAAAGTTGTAVDSALQFIGIEVLPPDSPIVGGSKPTGPFIEAPWDPITFGIKPLADGAALTDIDGNAANGTQVRVVIDIARAGVKPGDFNGYQKYVSQATLDAATAAGQPLRDLDGNAITAPGWIDFLARTDASGNRLTDGARFVVEGGFVTAFELVFTDNRFGDNSVLTNFIQDPNLPVKILKSQLLPTGDGKGLRVVGLPGESLWVDLSAVLADATLQNGFELVRVRAGQPLTLAAIGSTPDSGFFGDSRVELVVGDELRFVQVSGNLGRNVSPDVEISGEDNCVIVRLDDNGGDGDADDLVVKIKTSQSDPYPRTSQMARFQTGTELAYLDLSWIGAQGITLNLDVQTEAGQTNTIRLVRVDTDANGRPLGTVGGVAPSAGAAFDAAVRANLLSYSYSQTGIQTKTAPPLVLQGSQAGVYAPVLQTEDGRLYTFGAASSSDGSQHIKVMGANSFAFEDVPSVSADWDYNDTVVSFKVSDPEAPSLVLTENGEGLKVVAGTGSATGLWLDLNALLAQASSQNSLDLIRVAANGSRSQIGSIGATPNGTVLGSREVFIGVGETLQFVQNSNDDLIDTTPALQITQIGERFRVALNDNGLTGGDQDFNDLVIDVDRTPLQPCEDTVKLASRQLSSSDGILDLTNLGAEGARLKLSILTDSGSENTLSFVRVEIDPVTGEYTVAGKRVSEGQAFRDAVLANTVDFEATVGGSGTTATREWEVNQSQSGLYAAVLITPDETVYTFGDTSASDGRQHLKVLGESHFAFEDELLGQGSDFDYNDYTVKIETI